MKRTITLLALSLLLPIDVFARDVTTRFAVEGMECPACPPAVTKALKRVEGVKAVTASPRDGTVAVVADESVSPAKLVEAIANAGFSATVEKEN